MKKLIENLQVIYKKEIDNDNFGVANQSSKIRRGRDKIDLKQKLLKQKVGFR
jgi:hypothetical protein